MLRTSVALAFFNASSVMAATPTATGDEVVIFLHNAFFEKNKDGQANQRFRAYDVEGIAAALGKNRTLIAPECGSAAGR